MHDIFKQILYEIPKSKENSLNEIWQRNKVIATKNQRNKVSLKNVEMFKENFKT